MNDIEDQEMSRALRDLAGRHGTAGPAPVAELLHRGRRRRGLRLAAVTGSAAAVAAVAVFGATALAGGPSSTAAVGPAGQGTASVSASLSASTVRTGPTTPAEIADLLSSRFPTGYHADGRPTLVDSRSTGADAEERKRLAELQGGTPAPSRPLPETIGAGYTVTNGTKTGTVQLSIMHLPNGTGQLADPCNNLPGCSATRQPDGSTLVLSLAPAPADLPQVWRADLYRTDGTVIAAESGNVPLPGHGQDLYTGPPVLNGEALTALVLDPVWTQGAAGH
ncbi:hypothetical protein [Kitasatospora fiedleri]|uniref:hypothetical protein n=1 Tax=Kitasatospora fiedleri TaxID=2991545 RepID=UPI00249CB760|nr:hypothetical protein [Kitasatospora fiedleri]